MKNGHRNWPIEYRVCASTTCVCSSLLFKFPGPAAYGVFYACSCWLDICARALDINHEIIMSRYGIMHHIT